MFNNITYDIIFSTKVGTASVQNIVGKWWMGFWPSMLHTRPRQNINFIIVSCVSRPTYQKSFPTSSELSVNVANTLYLAFMSNKLEAAFTLLLTLLPRDGIFPDKISVVDTKQARFFLSTPQWFCSHFIVQCGKSIFFALKMLNEPEVKNWSLVLFSEENCLLLKWQLYSATASVQEDNFTREDNLTIPLYFRAIFDHADVGLSFVMFKIS